MKVWCDQIVHHLLKKPLLPHPTVVTISRWEELWQNCECLVEGYHFRLLLVFYFLKLSKWDPRSYIYKAKQYCTWNKVFLSRARVPGHVDFISCYLSCIRWDFFPLKRSIWCYPVDKTYVLDTCSQCPSLYTSTRVKGSPVRLNVEESSKGG